MNQRLFLQSKILRIFRFFVSKSLKANSNVEKVIWSYFVSSVASLSEKEDMLRVFRMFDTNGDG